MSGKHLCTIPPYGYKKDDHDKQQWRVDEDAAKVVKEIFSLCMQGFGPTQIARILTERGRETPIIYKNAESDFLSLRKKRNSPKFGLHKV